MSTTPPIACTLAPAEMPARMREIVSLGRDALVHVETTATTATLRFAGDDAVARRLDAVVAAESRCCAFLSFERSGDDEGHLLRIAAPAEGAFTLHALVAAFGG